jgi:uncharacterized protein (TIGR03067 family)
MKSASALVVLLIASAVWADESEVQAEKQKLEGRWTPARAEVEGKPVSSERNLSSVEFKGDKFLGLGREMTFVLDPTKKPKHIDLIAKIGGMDIKAPSIYELSEDELKLCIPLMKKGEAPELKRPEGFDSDVAPVILIRFKRIK